MNVAAVAAKKIKVVDVIHTIMIMKNVVVVVENMNL